MIGYDYGIKPSYMIIGDIEYTNLIHEAKPIALAYGFIPQFGLLVNPPFVSLIFEDAEKGKKCFEHFKKWAEGSNDGDAVALSFIETKEGGYAICVYEDFSFLINRTIPQYIQGEVIPFFTTLISFPLTVPKISEAYINFKKLSVEQPFVFCGSSKERGPFLETAIRKRNTQFFEEANIPQNTPERNYLNRKRVTKKISTSSLKPILGTPEKVSSRRIAKVKEFFPITLEKLKTKPIFQNVLTELNAQGLKKWQIMQATCNLVISYRMCKEVHFKGLEPQTAQAKIIEYLLNTFEEPRSSMPPDKYFSSEIINNQIEADMAELAKYIGWRSDVTTKEALLSYLKRKRYLNNDE